MVTHLFRNQETLVRFQPGAPILTFELTQATEEVRDLWQVRVGDFGRFTTVI